MIFLAVSCIMAEKERKDERMSKIPFAFAHVGVNANHKEEALRFLNFCREVLGLDAEETPISYMVADSKMEFMNEGGRGRLGHIGFYTPDIQAAMAYLEEKGYAMDPSTARYEADGKTLMLIYLKEEMNGFAIHLTTRK